MSVVTLYALFGDDIRILICPRYMDDIFYGLTTFSLIMFFVELLLGSLAQDGYLFGFYFWLDLVATVSLVSDIGWIWDPMIGAKEIESTENADASQLANSNKGAKVGSQASRVVRILRLIRLIRIVKLYKNAQ
jgi:hypothetical protein